ncbi:MAG: hypothetical protein ACYCWE_02460 [Eubacteriales bacterium]
MRNRLFISVFCAVLLFIMIGAPVKRILTDFGLIKSENVGNIIEVEKVYEDGAFLASFFNSIEQGKKLLNETYINHIPFYVDITTTAKAVKVSVNKPVTALLIDIGNDLLLNSQKVSPFTRVKTDTAEFTETETDEFTETETTEVTETETDGITETETAKVIETEPEPEPSYDPDYSASYIQGDKRHRYYEINATAQDGEPVEFLCRIPAEKNDTLRPVMKDQIAKLNALAAARDDVNWYVFTVTCIEDTKLAAEIFPAESKNELFETFISSLDDTIQTGYVKIDKIEDKVKKYFKTDHHWNVHGYLEAYHSLIAMLKNNYSDLGDIRKARVHTFEKIQYYGSNALAISSYKMNDVYAVADFSLPEHTLKINTDVPYGSTKTLEENLATYLAGNYNTEKGYSHYIQFYRIPNYIEYPANNTGRNLLFIGDSYSPPLLEVIASYFDKTFVRYVDSNMPPDLDYNKYIEENGITDVIVLEMSTRLVFNYYGDSIEGININ